MTTQNNHEGGGKKQSRTERLRKLEAQKNRMFDQGRQAEFYEKAAEFNELEGSFVLYQGREVDATRVNYLSGSIPTSTVDLDGDEDLFRDEQGRYYLRRKLGWFDPQGEPYKASGRAIVHRVSPTAAILWATVRLNSQTLDLRKDAWEALKASATSHAAQRFEDGSMNVSLHLPRSVAHLVRAVAELDECTPLEVVYGALQEWVVGALTTRPESEQDLRGAFSKHWPGKTDQYERDLDAGGHPEVWPPQQRPEKPFAADPYAWLDDHARELVSARLAAEPGLDVRDLLNAALDYMLGKIGRAHV